MAVFDLYGSGSDDIDRACKDIENALGVTFTARESVYQGGLYYSYRPHGDSGAEKFTLKRNVDPFDDEPVESEFPDAKLLLYVSYTSRASYIQMQLTNGATGFTLLKHKTL